MQIQIFVKLNAKRRYTCIYCIIHNVSAWRFQHWFKGYVYWNYSFHSGSWINETYSWNDGSTFWRWNVATTFRALFQVNSGVLQRGYIASSSCLSSKFGSWSTFDFFLFSSPKISMNLVLSLILSGTSRHHPCRCKSIKAKSS